MPTFLHAADIHLDSRLRGLESYEGAPVEAIRNATRRAFERLVQLALDERVDLVLLAGDLYDGDWTDYNTGLYLGRQLGRLREASIPVVVIQGNHDAANRMTRSLRLPDNVHLLRADRPETRRFESLGLSVHGQSYALAAETRDLASGYPAADPGLFNIGLLHTGLGGIEGHEPYAPCTLEGLRAREYDYWALGHIHKRQQPSVEPLVVFPGNLQGRHIRETGPKGASLVRFEPGGQVEAEFRRLDVLRWELCTLAGARYETEDELLEGWRGRLAALLAGEDDDRLLAVRVRVEGACGCHERLHARSQRLAAELRQIANDLAGDRVWVERVQVATTPARAVSTADGPIQELLGLIQELRESDARVLELARELREVGERVLPALADEADVPSLDDPQWLRELLDGAEPLLLSMLLEASGDR